MLFRYRWLLAMRTNLLENLPIEAEGSEFRSNRVVPEHLPSTIIEEEESVDKPEVSSNREPCSDCGQSLFSLMHFMCLEIGFRMKAFDTPSQFFEQPDLQQSLHVHLFPPQTLS